MYFSLLDVVRGEEDTQLRSRVPRQCKAIHEPFETLSAKAFFAYIYLQKRKLLVRNKKRSCCKGRFIRSKF